jgi:hypothetical protein
MAALHLENFWFLLLVYSSEFILLNGLFSSPIPHRTLRRKRLFVFVYNPKFTQSASQFVLNLHHSFLRDRAIDLSG